MEVKRHNPLEEAHKETEKDAATFICVIPPHAHIEQNTLVLTKEDACAFIASLAIQLSVS